MNATSGLCRKPCLSPKTPRQGFYLVDLGLAAHGLPSGALLHHRSGHSAGWGELMENC